MEGVRFGDPKYEMVCILQNFDQIAHRLQQSCAP